MLAYGGLVLSAALRAAPWLIKLGAALLGWIAGDMAVTDPLVGGWIAVNAPAPAAIAPALGAVFVFFAAPSAQPLTPAPSVAARPALAPLPPKPAAATPPPPRPRPKLVAAEAASAKLAVAAPKPLQSEPPEPEARSEPVRPGLSPEDRFAVVGVLVFALIAGIILMLVSYMTASTDASQPCAARRSDAASAPVALERGEREDLVERFGLAEQEALRLGAAKLHRRGSWARVSTPSAIVVMPKLDASSMIARTVSASPRAAPASARRNDRS